MILGTIKKHGKLNHSTVNYINNYPIYYLYAYALLIAEEMIKRGFNVSWDIINEYQTTEALNLYNRVKHENLIIYIEHNQEYFNECIDNLKQKGINIQITPTK